MRILLWISLACAPMRYNACQAVTIGSPCSDDEEDLLECTPMPASISSEDCRRTLVADHIVAKCVQTKGELSWQPHATCTDGLYCTTDGNQYQCEQSIQDCDEEQFWDSGR